MALKSEFKLTRSEFDQIYHYLNARDIHLQDYFFDCYNDALTIFEIHSEHDARLTFESINGPRLLLFLLNDFYYRVDGLTQQEIETLQEDNDFNARFINSAVDKYASLGQFKYEQTKLLSPYAMQISTINVYVNFILLKLTALFDPKLEFNLVLEMLHKAFTLCTTITNLVVAGFEAEALGAWRNLHELEAIIKLLVDDNVLQAYKTHIHYTAAFHQLLPKEKTDELFMVIKKELKKQGLKSKDLKKYIEYGWIQNVEAFDPKLHKYNFRDGVETLAGLSDYNKTYQIASEAAHSSPLLLFTDHSYFLSLTLVNLYQTFIRLEKIFLQFYQIIVSVEEVNYYSLARDNYLKDLELIEQRELEKLEKFTKQKNPSHLS